MIDFKLGDLRAPLISDGRNKAMHFAVESQALGDVLAHGFERAAVVVQLHSALSRISDGWRSLKAGGG